MQLPDDSPIATTEPSRGLDDRIEYRLDVGWRTADDVEHVARGSLIFERLLQLSRARLHLLEQPHILDCDHRLVGEGRDELDLLFGEGFDPSARSAR